MHEISTTGASGALLHPQVLQRRRIAARVGVSPSLAGVMAGLAWGAERRDHGLMLVGVVASRVEGHANG